MKVAIVQAYLPCRCTLDPINALRRALAVCCVFVVGMVLPDDWRSTLYADGVFLCLNGVEESTCPVSRLCFPMKSNEATRVIQALSGNMAFVQPFHSQECLVTESGAPPSILVIAFEQSLKSSACMPVDTDQQNTLD